MKNEATRSWFAVIALLLTLGNFSSAAEECAPIKTFADGRKPAREFFVSPVGNDSAEGTRSAPFQSVRRALREMAPGAAIRLLPGTYEGGFVLDSVSGSPEAPIWLGGEAGQPRPVLQGRSTGVRISRARYFVLENLEIRGATGNGINCDDGGDYANSNATRHVIFRNLSIHEIGSGKNQDGLKLSGVNDFFVLDCEFSKISVGGNAIDHVGCHRGVVARNVFRENGNAVQCKGGSEDIEILANRFIDNNGRGVNVGGSTGFQFFRPPLTTNAPNFEARNIRVIANLFRGGEVPIAYVGAVNSIAANNTIIEPRRYIVRILQETISKDAYNFLPSGQNQFINNLVTFNSAQCQVPISIGPNTAPETFEFANNLWHAQDRPDRSRPKFPTTESSGIYGANPNLQDDGSIAPDSPAVAKGKRLTTSREDLRRRCFKNPPSIGAHEIQ